MPNRDDFNRFAFSEPDLDMKRSVFNMPFNHKFSFNVGDVVPFFWQFCVPGDTYEINTSKVIRTQPLVAPVMDDLYVDTYYFFCPMRLIWEHTEEFFGENKNGHWTQPVDYNIPQLKLNINAALAPFYEFTKDSKTYKAYGFAEGTLGDYMGIPKIIIEDGEKANWTPTTVNMLPFKAYAQVINDWFRDENLQDPCNIDRAGTTVKDAIFTRNEFGVNVYERGGRPWRAAKYHDYFTSCLPQPQKGGEVVLANKFAPVYAGDDHLAQLNSVGASVLKYARSSDDPTSVDWEKTATGSTRVNYISSSLDNYVAASAASGSLSSMITPSNLWSANMMDITVASLRTAFAVQRYLERQARGGTRYIEYIKSFFGVTSPDARLQRAEYLGGSRLPLNISSVVQTSATESGLTPQGNVSGMSHTSESSQDVLYSCTEFGYLIGVTVCRYKHTYQNGLERHWLAKDVFDLYNPVFANLSEMPVYTKEIWNGKTAASDDTGVFGYQEAWADYRHKPNRVSGQMRSFSADSLDFWHFADKYVEMPTLSSGWIHEDNDNVERAMAVTTGEVDTLVNQLFADYMCNIKAVRPMPLYSVPGLIDHH